MCIYISVYVYTYIYISVYIYIVCMFVCTCAGTPASIHRFTFESFPAGLAPPKPAMLTAFKPPRLLRSCAYCRVKKHNSAGTNIRVNHRISHTCNAGDRMKPMPKASAQLSSAKSTPFVALMNTLWPLPSTNYNNYTGKTAFRECLCEVWISYLPTKRDQEVPAS